MIVCQCTRLNSDDVSWTVSGYALLDPHRPVTPLAVFMSCGKRPRCGNCLPLIARLIEECHMHARE